MENNNSRKEKLWLFVFGIVMVSILVFAMSIQIKKQDVQINSYYEQSSQYEIRVCLADGSTRESM